MQIPGLRLLLEELDGSYHSQRVRTMALLGRDNAADAALGDLLDQLSGESGYHHCLALVAAAAAGDQGRLRSALNHPAPRVRSFALAHLDPAGVAPADLIAALLHGSAEDRRLLRRFVNRHGLTDVAEAAIGDVRRELGDAEAAALLPACGHGTVRRLLPDLLHATASLRVLARRHPQVVLELFGQELDGLSRRQRDLFWCQITAALRELALADPAGTLQLVEDAGPSWIVPWGLHPALGFLIRFAPSRVARLVATEDFARQYGWRAPGWLMRNSKFFSRDDQVAIARAFREHEALFFAWIAWLAPSTRAEVFARALDGVDTTSRIWVTDHLDVLPSETRHAEARRILGLRAIRGSEVLTLQYVAVLPFSEARPALVAEAGRAKAEDRALGYSLLVGCARRERSPAAVDDVLQVCARLKNEQDPVRFAALRALATLPGSAFREEHLDDLQTLVQAVVEARDTSSATRREVTTIALSLLADAADDPTSLRFTFALGVLDRVVGPRGSVSLPRLDRVLRREVETHLIDTLMPRIEREASVERYSLAVSLAEALGRRAWGHAGLQDVLARAMGATSDSTVRMAVSLWLAPPRTRSERVAQVVARDESMVALPVVLTTLVRSRQDLLDVLLQSRPLKGRFLGGTTRYVPIIADGFDRWLPRQCAAYRAALDSLIATPATPEWAKVDAVRTLARLPETGLDALVPYLGSSDVPIQEAALSGLAWTDQPGRALQRLLEFAGTDRARVAVYAVTRSARFVPRHELGPPLVALVASARAKVTAKKEAARLLGTLRPPGAVDALVDTFDSDDVHRDVRVAIGRSLRASLDDDRAWPILARLASGSDDEARSLLETGPWHLPPRHRPRYADLVLALTRSGSSRVKAEASAALGSWARWSEGAPAVVCATIEDLAAPEWRPALTALPVMLADGAGWGDAVALVSALAGRVDSPDWNAGGERDLPSAQRLEAVVTAVAGLSLEDRADHRADLLLLAAPLSGPEELTVRLAAVDWSAPAPALTDIGRRLDARPLLAPAGMQAAAAALRRDEKAWSADALGVAADELIEEGSVGAGALALQLVSSAGARFGWPEAWRARLRALRAHPSADVATLAARVWTAHE